MGSRTQNHILEDESRRFFSGLLSKHWVYRDKHQDYGIDAEVEIFDASGNGTGLVFWVQLKGTAAKDSKTIRSVSFKNEKIGQFKSYELPVLIVRYSSVMKMCYFKWIGSVVQSNANVKSTNIYFADEHLWNDGSADQICSYLNRRGNIKNGNLRFPVKTFLKRVASNGKSKVPYSRITFLKNSLSTLPKYFSLTNDEKESSLQILAEDRQLVFSVTDLAFSGLGFGEVFINSQEMEKVNKAILLTFSAALFELNRDDLGSNVFFENDLFTLAKRDSVYLTHFLSRLLLGKDFSRTMKLLNDHLSLEPQDNNFLETVINMIILPRRGEYDERELGLVEDFLLLSLKLNISGHDYGKATSCYNLGNFYRGMGNLPVAFGYFIRTKRLNPGYKKQAHFLEEVAFILFQLGRCYLAEQLFRKAISLGGASEFVKAYIGDCLLFRGRYQEAANVFDEFLAGQHQSSDHLDEWSLKFSCIRTLLEHDYPVEQKRNIALGNRCAEAGKYDEALEADMLNARAWYEMGVEFNAENDQSSAFVAFVMVGILKKDFVAAWANATMIGFTSDIHQFLVINTIKIAFYYNGQNYINLVSQVLEDSKHPGRDALLEWMDKILVKLHKPPLTIRFFNGEGTDNRVDFQG